MTERPLPVVIATFDSECPICGHTVIGGVDEIVKLDNLWVHAECAEGEGCSIARY